MKPESNENPAEFSELTPQKFVLSIDHAETGVPVAQVVLSLRDSEILIESQNFIDAFWSVRLEGIDESDRNEGLKKKEENQGLRKAFFLTIDPAVYIGSCDCKIVIYDSNKIIVESRLIQAGETCIFESDQVDEKFRFQVRARVGSDYVPSTHYLTAVQDSHKLEIPDHLIQTQNQLQFTERENVILAPLYRPPGAGAKGPDGIIFASVDGEEIPEAMRFRMGSQPYLLGVKSDAARRVDRQVIYAGLQNPSYGHFLTEGIARLWLAKLRPEMPIVWSGGTRELTGLQIKILAAVGIKNEHIFLDEPTEFSSVLFPFPGLTLGDNCLQAYADLIGEFPVQEIIPGKKLYLSRSRLEHSRGATGIEQDLERLLEKFGFTIFSPEIYSLEEQAREISSAEIVLGIEGSALHTLLMIKPGMKTKFFAIGRHRYGEGVFEHIKQAKSLDYRTLVFTKSSKIASAREEIELDFDLLEKVVTETNGLEDQTTLLGSVTAEPFEKQVAYADLLKRSKAKLSHLEKACLKEIQSLQQTKNREKISELWARLPSISINKMAPRKKNHPAHSAEFDAPLEIEIPLDPPERQSSSEVVVPLSEELTMHAYEEIMPRGSSNIAVLALKILQEGWKLAKYPPVNLRSPIIWAQSSADYRSHNFHLHSWDPIDAILAAHSEGRSKAFLSVAIDFALDWIDFNSKNLADRTDTPFVWYDMAVGLRSYRLAYIIEAATVEGLFKEGVREILWTSLLEHAAYLADDEKIAFHNNHGYYQVAGQLAMGRRFASDSFEMRNALEMGSLRLKRMLEQQFASDGVHREHSPDYHRMVYDTLKALIDAGLVSDPQTVDFSRRIEQAFSWFILPNQHIVNFGDSDYRSVARKLSEVEGKWATAEMRYIASGGKLGSLPPGDAMTFAEGGYFVVRRPSSEVPGDFSRSSYLAQNAAFHSRTHKHADDLSFVWSDRGCNLLVDAGRYGYIGKAEQGSDLWLDGHWYSDPNRVYCESTRAHNTLEFDGLNYPRKGVKPYGSALKRWVKNESDGIFAVETECRHFRSIRRSRVLVFKPAQWLLVFDWFYDNEQAQHTAKQWFHLAPDLQLSPKGEGYSIGVPTSAQPLRVASLLEGSTASCLYLADQEPQMQGWWSSKERDIVPAYAFCYEMAGVSEGSMATLFSFSTQLKGDKVWSKANASGRKAQFRWTDDAGVHELKLDRSPELPALGLVYSSNVS